MFGENVEVLEELIEIIKSAKYRFIDKSKKNSGECEIINLISTTPMVFEQWDVFDFDFDFQLDNEIEDIVEVDKEVVKDKTLEVQALNIIHDASKFYFSVLGIETYSKITKQKSQLSTTLNTIDLQTTTGNIDTGATTPVTFYMPGGRQQMLLKVNVNNKVTDIISKVMASHKAQSLAPALMYDLPECYELRLHEGDGEPDLDFPALERSKQLRDYGNANELCLRCKDSSKSQLSRSASTVAAAISSVAVGIATTPLILPSSSSSGSNSIGGVFGQIVEGMKLAGGVASDRKGSAVSESGGPMVLPTNMVMVMLPNAGHVRLRVGETTTVKDLLPLIAKKHRLRLFTDEYVFIMPERERTRLQLMTPMVDLKALVLTLGVKEFELQKRKYADSALPPPVPPPGSSSDSSIASKLNKSILNQRNLSDTSAAIYQEWSVVQKSVGTNRKTEEAVILGIDLHKIYVRKSVWTSQQTDCYRARAVSRSQSQHYVSSVSKIDIIDSDPSTFRILWNDVREMRYVDYTCESDRECLEIVAKIRHLTQYKPK